MKLEIQLGKKKNGHKLDIDIENNLIVRGTQNDDLTGCLTKKLMNELESKYGDRIEIWSVGDDYGRTFINRQFSYCEYERFWKDINEEIRERDDIIHGCYPDYEEWFGQDFIDLNL